MIPEINYFAPKTIAKALALLTKLPEAKVLAGGTDILTGFHQRSSRFIDTSALIDINHIPAFKKIIRRGELLFIGAGCTFTSIAEHKAVKKFFPLLVEAASGVGSLQIRNRATIAGNVVNNAPCADSVPALLVYNADIVIASIEGEKQMPLSEFLIKPYKTQIARGELVTAFVLKIPAENYRGRFVKVGRRSGVAISRITLATLLDCHDGIIRDIRIASGAITPIGLRFFELEDMLRGKPVSIDLAKTTALELGKLIHEKTGVRWSTPYKLPVVQQICYQQLHELFEAKE